MTVLFSEFFPVWAAIAGRDRAPIIFGRDFLPIFSPSLHIRHQRRRNLAVRRHAGRDALALEETSVGLVHAGAHFFGDLGSMKVSFLHVVEPLLDAVGKHLRTAARAV